MRLTPRQAAIVGAYTGVLAGPFDQLHEYVEEIMGRPVYTHELATKADEIRDAARADFLDICQPREVHA